MGVDELDWTLAESEPFVDLVGPFWMAPFRDGVGRFRFTAERKHQNRRKTVHGGMITTFADQVLGMTARQHDWDRTQATAQLDVHFVDAVWEGETVEATCRILRHTKTLVFMDGILTVGDRTVATARGVWKLLKPTKAHAEEDVGEYEAK